MSKDLMELVKECEVYRGPDGITKGEIVISEYRDLGFVKATEGTHQKNLEISKRQRIYEFEYRVITTEAIWKFLQRKVKLYDKEHKPKPAKKTSSDGPSVGISALAKLVRNSMANGDLVHTPIMEPMEPQPGDVFDISSLERAREEVRRFSMVHPASFGMEDEHRSGQEQFSIHREEILREAEEREQRRQYEALHAINDSNPTWVIRNNPNPTWVMRSGLHPLETCSIYEKTCDYDKHDPETIGRFEWKEVPVEEYEGLPPAPVLETFKEHKARKVFDYFTIASVNSVPDPLLLGRIDGDDDNRWFIAQWGKDVCLDDLI